MEIFKKIKKLFKKNKNSNVLLTDKNRKIVKKRRSFKINLEFLHKLKTLKGKYIPYFFILLVLIVIIILGLIIGPFFRVKQIEITRKDNITNMDIAYKSIDLLRGTKMFSVNEVDVYTRFKNYQDNIKSIKLRLKLPSTISIEVESYKEQYNIIINDSTYLLLENGTLIPSSHSKNLRLLNIKTNIDKNKFVEYKQVFNPIYINRIEVILKRFEENILSIGIKDIYYYEAERELHIELIDGTLILFSIDNDNEVTSQIEKLAIFNKDYDGINKGIFVYLDLRIRNKVFYCPIESKKQCDANLKGIYN